MHDHLQKTISDHQLSIDELNEIIEQKTTENDELNAKLKSMENDNKEVEIKFKEWEASFSETSKAQNNKIEFMKKEIAKVIAEKDELRNMLSSKD